MSNTLRRKNVKLDSWVTHDWEMQEGNFIKVKKQGTILTKAVAKYRSDGKKRTRGQYPAYFRKALNKKLRAKQRMTTYDIVHKGADQICVPEFIKNGLWEYW